MSNLRELQEELAELRELLEHPGWTKWLNPAYANWFTKEIQSLLHPKGATNAEDLTLIRGRAAVLSDVLAYPRKRIESLQTEIAQLREDEDES